MMIMYLLWLQSYKHFRKVPNKSRKKIDLFRCENTKGDSRLAATFLLQAHAGCCSEGCEDC